MRLLLLLSIAVLAAAARNRYNLKGCYRNSGRIYEHSVGREGRETQIYYNAPGISKSDGLFAYRKATVSSRNDHRLAIIPFLS
ncbi:hypothetical protein Y032_0086g1910 [Ancylostoma ceylanicum]|uniref:Uncharacterized protein n=1 Tax=Ancylostoma ceylanicum TaxID=53326 RepID=A0A016TPV1_9BILA|nr:hypothetical protein Y032_0086g1910 [Ancylostoma ceylanicum]